MGDILWDAARTAWKTAQEQGRASKSLTPRAPERGDFIVDGVTHTLTLFDTTSRGRDIAKAAIRTGVGLPSLTFVVADDAKP